MYAETRPNGANIARSSSAGLPPPSRAMCWDVVASVGRIVSEEMPGGRVRHRLDFGWLDGKRIRVNSIPSPAGGGRRLPISDEKTAQRVLDAIRADMLSGKTLEQALAPYRVGAASEDLVETQLAHYLATWDKLVAQGKRSPNSLREIKTYARIGGAFEHWWGWSIHRITGADIADWQLLLGERVNPHTGGVISEKTQRNISDRFRTFLRWLHDRGRIAEVPRFPVIKTDRPVTKVLTIEDQRRVLDAIPYELRGAFLAAANHSLRMGEIRALTVDDYKDGRIHVARAIKGATVGAPTGGTKNDSEEWIEIWNPELVEWIEDRLGRLTSEERLRGEIILFSNPRADRDTNPTQQWTPSALRRVWDRACRQVGVDINFQQGTRHTTTTALAPHLPERLLRKFTRHRTGAALNHYTARVEAPKAATIREIMGRRPGP